MKNKSAQVDILFIMGGRFEDGPLPASSAGARFWTVIPYAKSLVTASSYPENRMDSDNRHISPEHLLGPAELAHVLGRMADEIATRFEATLDLALVGIKQRGDLLARRLSDLLEARLKTVIPVGSLDITLYRDDFESLSEQPIVGATQIDFPVAGRTIVLVDDVLFTGRTVRAALTELADLGRATRVALAILVDRGGRELPITPDVVGISLTIAPSQHVQVMLKELDNRDGVVLHHAADPKP
jgi:pyrimidine operon attenuation protein/uracil phosphoribosyltransferase